jgi:23S rRNA pseudouridine1911/1915/1917 synthase
MPLNRGFTYTERVPPRSRGRTLLEHLADACRHSTLEQWTERLARGEVTLEGQLAGGAERLSQICWRRPPWEEPAAPRRFTLIHEDEALLAVDKPSGLPTLPSGGYLENTLLHLVREAYPGAHRTGLGGRPPGWCSSRARKGPPDAD